MTPTEDEINDMMKDQAKSHLAYIISYTFSIPLSSAHDLINTCQYEVNDCLDGCSMYKTPAEVICDYFSLPDLFIWMFL